MNDQLRNKQRILLGLERLESLFASYDFVATGIFAARMQALRSLLRFGRLPRVLLCGRRGSGKSSLINALLNRDLAKTGAVEDTTLVAQHYAIRLAQSDSEWIDSAGLSAGAVSGVRADSLQEIVANYPPSVLLFLHPASEVDAGIDAEMTAIREAFDTLRSEQLRVPVLVGLATKLDELEPLAAHQPPYEDVEKAKNIAHSARVLRAAFVRHGLNVHTVLAVNTWFDATTDLRWNLTSLEQLLESLVQAPVLARVIGEARVLYRRLGIAAIESFITLADKHGAQTILPVMVERMRAIAPVAVHADDQTALLGAEASPARWLRTAMGSLGAKQLENAIGKANVRSAGRAIVDQWLLAPDVAFANLVADPLSPRIPLSRV